MEQMQPTPPCGRPPIMTSTKRKFSGKRETCTFQLLGSITFFLFFKINLFIYLFLAAFCLHCCSQAFSSCGEQGLLCAAVRGLLIAVASPVAEHSSRRTGFSSCGTRLSCSVACGIFPDQRLNRVPFTGRRILKHCATREVPNYLFF